MIIVVGSDPVFMFGSLPPFGLTPVFEMAKEVPNLWNGENVAHKAHQFIILEVCSISFDLKLIDMNVAKIQLEISVF